MVNYYEENRSALIRYFTAACKSVSTKPMYGLEIERFLVREEDGRSIPYYGKDGVEGLLEELAPDFGDHKYSEGHLIGMSRGDLALSIEPAAQFEVSFSPQDGIAEIEKVYRSYEEELRPHLKKRGLRLKAFGYQPKSRIGDLPLIPKKRYEHMIRYFSDLHGLGPNMMKGSASVQLSVDFYSERHLMEQYFAIYTFLPMLAYLTDNAPVFEGAPNTGPLLRMKIWRETDPARVDVRPFLKDGRMDFESYVDFLMQTPVIVKESPQGDLFSTETIGELCAEERFDKAGLEHLMSMVFPMLRIKNFLEIRIADSMPFEPAKAYLLLLKGLLANLHDSVEFAEQLREGDPCWYGHALDGIVREGASWKTPAGDLRDASVRLVGIALDGLSVREHADLERYLPLIRRSGKLIGEGNFE